MLVAGEWVFTFGLRVKQFIVPKKVPLHRRHFRPGVIESCAVVVAKPVQLVPDEDHRVAVEVEVRGSDSVRQSHHGVDLHNLAVFEISRRRSATIGCEGVQFSFAWSMFGRDLAVDLVEDVGEEDGG